MRKRGTVRPEQGTLEQIGELAGSIMKILIAFFGTLSANQIQNLIGRKKEVARVIFRAITSAISEMVGIVQETFHPHLKWWMEFYKDEGIIIDPDSFTIPPKPEGDWWLIVVAPGLTYNQVLAMLRKKFKVWVWTEDLDRAMDMTKEQRGATDKPYAVWVKANIEADPKLANKSANDLAGQDMITLMERLFLEVFYFCHINLGKHLDINNVTLCAGSRYREGSVPHIYFDSRVGQVNVDDCNPGKSDDDLRARQAVY